jgi:hypothetical protein
MDTADTARVIAFLREFMAADLEVEKAYANTDRANYPRLLGRLKGFFACGAGPGHSLLVSDNARQDIRDALAEQALTLVPQILFKLKRWEHAVEGTLYQAYVSTSAPSKKKGYFQSLLVKDLQGRLAIVARYAVCRACSATGQHAGKRCPDCELPGWQYLDGLKLTDLGTPSGVVRFEAPTNTMFLVEYESD